MSLQLVKSKMGGSASYAVDGARTCLARPASAARDQFNGGRYDGQNGIRIPLLGPVMAQRAAEVTAGELASNTGRIVFIRMTRSGRQIEPIIALKTMHLVDDEVGTS